MKILITFHFMHEVWNHVDKKKNQQASHVPKLVLNYVRSSGKHPHIKCEHTVLAELHQQQFTPSCFITHGYAIPHLFKPDCTIFQHCYSGYQRLLGAGQLSWHICWNSIFFLKTCWPVFSLLILTSRLTHNLHQ